MPDHVNSPGRVAVGEYIVDRNDERLIGPSGPVKLGNKAFRVLLSLIDNDGQLVSKDQLFTTVWDGMIVSESALTSTIKELRKALGDGSKSPKYIESVYGRGYRLIAEISEAPRSLEVSKEFTTNLYREQSRPPLIVVSEFNDDAVADTVPYAGPALRELVLSGLARFREIHLLSDEKFDDHPLNVSREDRAYQLTATLLPDKSSARVIVRLRRIGDSRILWVESMSIAKEGFFDGVDRIVRKIVGAVLPVVDQDVFQSLNVSGSLFDRYVKARHEVFSSNDFAVALKAARAFEGMIRENPDFTLPYWPLATMYNTDYFYTGLGSSNDESRAKAMKLARKLISLDPVDFQGQLSFAFCNLHAGQWAIAKSIADKALEQNPHNPDKFNAIATLLTFLGEFDRVEELMNRSKELQPQPSDWFFEDLGRLYLLTGRHQEAIDNLSIIQDPTIWSHLYLVLAAIKLDKPGAINNFADWRQRVISSWYDGTLPDNARIMEFVRFHHRFKDDVGEEFFALIESALSAVAN